MATIGQTSNDGWLLTRDTNNSNTLQIKWNEDDTADRVLNIEVDEDDRTLEITGESKIDQDVSTESSPTFEDVTLSERDASAVLLTDSDSKTTTQVLEDGQLIIGETGESPSAATLTAGTGISITNGAGSITVDSIGGGIKWNTASENTNAVVNNGYITTHADNNIIISLPETFAVGSVVAVAGSGAGKFTLKSFAGTTIKFGSLSTKAEGTIVADVANCALKVVAVVANTTWVVSDSSGKFNVEVS
jgi:hypothetical protein